jgi:hypothetical protein
MLEVSHASCLSALSAFTLMRHHFMHLPAMDSINPEKSCLQNTFQQGPWLYTHIFPWRGAKNSYWRALINQATQYPARMPTLFSRSYWLYFPQADWKHVCISRPRFFGIKLIIHVPYLHIHSEFQACNLKPSQSQSSHQPSHRPPHSQRQPSSSRSQSPSRHP